MFCFFFFSSRRRHTRYWRDWSSDVCSSDLAIPISSGSRWTGLLPGDPVHRLPEEIGMAVMAPVFLDQMDQRSEKRRVGKECRSRWWEDHGKKKIRDREEKRRIRKRRVKDEE